jgi:hypothetical protein
MVVMAHTEADVADVNALIRWITQHGGFVNEQRMQAFSTPEIGTGIKVKECPQCLDGSGRIEPGTDEGQHDPLGSDPLLLRVPYKLHLHPFSELHSPHTLSVIKHLYESGVIEYEALLAVALLLELRNKSSLWRPYLDTLPVLVPRFGSRLRRDDIEVLYATGNRHNLAVLAEQRVALDNGRYEAVIKACGVTTTLTRSEYLFAVSLVNSRSFGEEPQHFAGMRDKGYERGTSVAVLVPYLDLINHCERPVHDNRYRYEWRDGGGGGNDEEEAASIDLVYYASSSRIWMPGDELCNSYHVDPFSITHFLYYGFVVPTNYSTSLTRCDDIVSQFDDIAQHFQFTAASKCDIAFDIARLSGLDDTIRSATLDANYPVNRRVLLIKVLLKYTEAVDEISKQYAAIEYPSPVMCAWLRETLSLCHAAQETLLLFYDRCSSFPS